MIDADAVLWNRNIHYHRVVLDAVPAGCARALDVGCGEGLLSRQLRQRVPDVTAVDVDQESIERARRQDPNGDITYLCEDFFSDTLMPRSFDFIASVAALHHMDAGAALDRMADLLRPGGVLAIVGLARSELVDLPVDALCVIATWAHRLTKPYWHQTSPMVWPPPESYRGMRRIAEQRLPGARYHRHLLGRYSVMWRKRA